MEFIISHFMGAVGALSILYVPFFIWMLIDCVRNEPDRGIWIFLMIFLQGIGCFAYFFIRFLPRGNFGFLNSLVARFQTKELKRLRVEAKQIGNPYHWVHYGEKLRELQQYSKAEKAYRTALEKEPENIQALWGLAICLENQKQFEEALQIVTQVYQQDPAYKFGDVSLAYARLLLALERWKEAREHLESHVKRWRQPEGLYLLARCQFHQNDRDQAKETLEMLIMDIEASPSAIARKQKTWKSKAKKLLRAN